MLKTLVFTGALAVLLGGAAPITPYSPVSPIAQSRVVDQCFDDCVRICMQHSGADQTACQFECMMTTCLAEVPLEMTRLHSVARRD